MAAAAIAGADAEGIDIPFTDGARTMDYELLEALQKGDVTVVRRFLSQETVSSEAIDHAVAFERLEVGRRSWRGVTVGGNSALHIVADFGHLKLAKQICARDSSLLTASNVAGETPLHCAVRTGADQIVSLFITVGRQDGGCRLEEVLRATDREGKTALHVAAQKGHAAAAKELMSADPGLAAIVDSKGISPLYVAVLSGSLEVVKILIESYADGGDTPEASYAGPNGQTALHAAAMIENPKIAENLLQWKSILTKKVDNSKSSPLHYLAATSNNYMNPGIWIFLCLKVIAIHGPHRSDQLVDEMTTKLDQEREQKKYETITQSLIVVSVLIAAVTFAAAFTMPGGYKADDHQNGGTPTLATKYAFKAFIFSDSLAFIFSIMATISLLYVGSLTVDPSLWMKFFQRSINYLNTAALGMVIAFTMAVYVVLAPVNNGIAISICVLCFTFILFDDCLFIGQIYRLICTLKSREGWLGICKIREPIRLVI